MSRETIRQRVEARRICRVCHRGKAQCAAPTNFGKPVERKPHEWDPTEGAQTREALLLLAVADAAAAYEAMEHEAGCADPDCALAPLLDALAALEAAP